MDMVAQDGYKVLSLGKGKILPHKSYVGICNYHSRIRQSAADEKSRGMSTQGKACRPRVDMTCIGIDLYFQSSPPIALAVGRQTLCPLVDIPFV